MGEKLLPPVKSKKGTKPPAPVPVPTSIGTLAAMRQAEVPKNVPQPGSGGSFMDMLGLTGVAKTLTQPGAALPAQDSPDYMALFNNLLNTMAGPAPTFSFDASPYAQAISQAQRQAGMGQQVINQGGKDLVAQLGQMRSQWEGRNAEDMGRIQQIQGQAQAQATRGIDPVIEDLRRQGVDVTGIQTTANQRAGTLADQAALQNTLSQRVTQNTGNTLDATGRSAVTQGAGALNNLATNLSSVVNAIGQQQAKAAAAAQSSYMDQLQSYNKNRMGTGSDLLTMLSESGLLGGEAAGPGDQISTARSTFRNQIAGRPDPTAAKTMATLDLLDKGEMTPEDVAANLAAPAKGPDDKPLEGATKDDGKIMTMREYLTQVEKVDVGTYEKWIKDYYYPTVKEPSESDKKKSDKTTLINRLLGVK